jgi:hypothetical protein
VAEERFPTEEELREAFDRVRVGDVLVNALMATVSLGFRHVSGEARDLSQAKLAIESLRALEPVLREGGVEEAVLRDLEQARANLQLAYAKAVSEAPVEPRPSEQSSASAENADDATSDSSA